MTKIFGVVRLSIILSFVTSSWGGGYNGYGPSASSRPHYTNLVVGGGPGGLYTAWRLSSERSQNETTAVYEWSPVRLGGRAFTKVFSTGQFLDLGAWRFLPSQLLLNRVLEKLDLTHLITDFPVTDNRLYYLRGKHIYENEIPRKGVPYNTIYRTENPDSLFSDVSQKLAPALLNSNDTVGVRPEWCRFWDEGKFPSNVRSDVFNRNDRLEDIGWWNLLLDQLGSEGFQYAADSNGFTAHVVNGHAAATVYELADYGSSVTYQRLKPGYSKLVDTFEDELLKNHVEINLGKRLTKFHWNARERKFYSTFTRYNKYGEASPDTLEVTSDRLFLCIPKRSLELLEETEVVGNNWPANTERRVLKHSLGRFYIDSIIRRPAYKIALLYDHPWWLNATYKPHLNISSESNLGPTVTDLPLRQIFYFGNNNENKHAKPMYALLASYNDMRFTDYWKELEIPPTESLRDLEPHFFLQPLFSGTKITHVMQRVLREQLNKVHYKPSDGMQVPFATEGYYMDWGHDPWASGYHKWKAHYKIVEAMFYMTRPSELIGVEVPVHVAGEAYAFDQTWMEGAFQTAESALVDKVGLKPLLGPHSSYLLICRPKCASNK